MGTIDVIGSQLDVASIVKQLMQLERQPVYRMEDQIASMQKKISAYQSLNTRLSALSNSVNMLLYGSTSAPFFTPGTFDLRKSTSVFASSTATSSNGNVLTASATGVASQGTYSITVDRLAQAKTSVSKGFESVNHDISPFEGTISIGDKSINIKLDSTLREQIMSSKEIDNQTDQIAGFGAITLFVNGTTHTIEFNEGDNKTWQDVKDEINNISGVSADFIPATTEGNEDKWQLQVTAEKPGSAGAFTIGVSGESDFTGNFGFTTTQSSRDNPTLRDLQQAINEAASKEGLAINASIINAGAFTDEEDDSVVGGFRLMITSKETGLANAFKLDGDFTEGSFGFTDTQSAADARLAINGVVINSSSNAIKDAIEGVTINLRNVTKEGETVQLELGVDTDAIVSAVQDMISAYNAVSSFINSQFAYSTTRGTDSLGQSQTSISAGVLSGDATLRSIQSSLQSIISGGGIPPGENAGIRSIGQVGISYDQYGQLTLDENKLKEALSKDFDAVAKFFLGYDKTVEGESGESVQRVGGMFTNMGEALKGLTNPLRNPIKNALDGINNNIRNLEQSIEAYELRLQVKEDLLFAQFSAADEALRMMRVTLGNISSSLASLMNNN